jgi:hypothetical protein
MPARARRLLRLRTLVAFIVCVQGAGTARGACTGDCDGNLSVAVAELIRSVNIALGLSALGLCPAIDEDESGDASIGELVGAVNRALNGCEGAATATPPNTHTATPTATATANQPPVLPTASIYRSFPGFPIRIQLAADPEGRAVQCAVDNPPAGAAVEEQRVLVWTPTDDQLGPFYLPFTCSDDGTPEASASGQLTFRIAPRDPCVIPDCEPATGCTTTLTPLDQPCCTGAPTARVAEPVADCPAGRVVYAGRNDDIDTFGRLQNCDVLPVTNFMQSGAEVLFHVETRCMNTLNRLRLRARMDSNAANHPLMFDTESLPYLFGEYDDGFARHRSYRFGVNQPSPFFDIEGAEGNLTLILSEQNGTATVTHQVRVRLTFTPQPDLPDVDPSPPPTPTSAP